MTATTTAAPTGSAETKGATETKASETQSTTGTTKAADQTTEITSMLGGADDTAKGKPEEKSKVEAKTGEAAKPGSKVDDKALDITLPDALKDKADEASLTEFKTIAKEKGLTSEAASGIAAWWLEKQAQEVVRQDTLVQQQSDAWLGEIKKDQELGGAKLAETQNMVTKAFAKFGDPATSKAMTEMGLQNFPGLVRMFARIGRALAEDNGTALGKSPGAGKPTSRDERLSALYDNSSSKAT